jgi:hypothetical protein
MKISPITAILRTVLIAAIAAVLATSFVIAENPPAKSTQHGTPHAYVEKREMPDPAKLKRVSEDGAEVLIDGTLRVFEPIYTKNIDFVEISTSVKPVSNHVRLYAVSVGTYTVIRVQFDDGQDKVLINN